MLHIILSLYRYNNRVACCSMTTYGKRFAVLYGPTPKSNIKGGVGVGNGACVKENVPAGPGVRLLTQIRNQCRQKKKERDGRRKIWYRR